MKMSIESTVKRAPMWTMSTTCSAPSTGAWVPAPGHYHSDKDFTAHKYEKLPVFTWGKQKRQGYEARYSLPDVCTYDPPLGPYDEKKGTRKDDPTKDYSPKIKFGSAPRMPKHHLHEVPGPGSYPVQVEKARLSKSMAWRTRIPTSADDNPAPGHYEPKGVSAAQTNRQNLGGTGERFRHPGVGTPKTLGPGSYPKSTEQAIGASYKNDPTYSFKESRRDLRGKMANPGPSSAWSSFG